MAPAWLPLVRRAAGARAAYVFSGLGYTWAAMCKYLSSLGSHAPGHSVVVRVLLCLQIIDLVDHSDPLLLLLLLLLPSGHQTNKKLTDVYMTANGAKAAKRAEQFKADGNAAFKAFKLDSAIELYSAAMAAAPTVPTYCANRSAALYEAGLYAESVSDVENAFSLQCDEALAAKLALRAARCALWLGTASKAQKWLQHSSLRADSAAGALAAQVKDVQAHADACSAVSKLQHTPQLLQLAAGGGPDAPGLLRAIARPLPPCLFVSGHDHVQSMFHGARLSLPAKAASQRHRCRP